MNLLDRIDRRLSDTRARINAHDFEDCATSLRSPVHRSLIPITGGSDFGLDAEITEDSRITGLIITSSRSWDGAKRSLRDSLRSMRNNHVTVERVVGEFGGREVMWVLELPEPHVGPEQVRIKVAAAPVHPADVNIRTGLSTKCSPGMNPPSDGGGKWPERSMKSGKGTRPELTLGVEVIAVT